MPHRSRLRGSLSCIAAALLLGGGCKHRACDPGDMELQLVIHPAVPLNHDDRGDSLPTTIHVYQLADRQGLSRTLSMEHLLGDPQAALGESYVDEESLVIWPSTDHHQPLKPRPETQHILLVAEYRRLLGTTWYAEYDLPSRVDHDAAVCTAVKRAKRRRRGAKPVGPPCFFVTMSGYQVDGSPSGADFAGAKPGSCAPPPWMYEIDPKVKRQTKRKHRRRGRGRLGGLLRPAAPAAPRAIPSPKTPGIPVPGAR
ncbi:MAG: type VI secretion system lipoprotein TssJ [Nannocystis sp.]|nr:type VI secretion system lipoprotein TssJ [Nannocystis sp.]